MHDSEHKEKSTWETLGVRDHLQAQQPWAGVSLLSGTMGGAIPVTSGTSVSAVGADHYTPNMDWCPEQRTSPQGGSFFIHKMSDDPIYHRPGYACNSPAGALRHRNGTHRLPGEPRSPGFWSSGNIFPVFIHQGQGHVAKWALHFCHSP